MRSRAWVSRYVWSMKHTILAALLTLLIFLPARAQINFSDSLRISLLTCSAGPDAYERFGHAGLRVQDLRNSQMDVTFHYGVFSFNAPHFIYRFVKGETDYMLGAVPTSYFIQDYEQRGLWMVQQELNLDSAQCQDILQRLLINYLPENRTYRYSYFFDNCSTRPYHLVDNATDHAIRYDSTWVKAITLRQMVQQCTGVKNWLDFGIALAVAGLADRPTVYKEQLFLPEYLMRAYAHAIIPVKNDSIDDVYLPLVNRTDTLLTMRPDVEEAIVAPDLISPTTVCGILLLMALILSGLEWKQRQTEKDKQSHSITVAVNIYDSILFLVLGLTGCIVWFLNFLSEHPAVDHNINCFWLLPTHVVLSVVLWWKKLNRTCAIYCGISFAAVIVYVIADWITGQYCPPAFLLLLATILLRCYLRATRK